MFNIKCLRGLRYGNGHATNKQRITKVMLLQVLTIVGSGFIASLAYAQAPADTKRIRPVVQKMIGTKMIAGAVVMVSHQNQTVVYFEAQGQRDMKNACR